MLNHDGVLAQLSEALEQQQQALGATLAKLEAELPPEAEFRLHWRYEELPDSPLGRQVRKLRQLLWTPLRLSAEPVVVSAKTQLNVEALRTRIADALFDQVRTLTELVRQQWLSFPYVSVRCIVGSYLTRSIRRASRSLGGSSRARTSRSSAGSSGLRSLLSSGRHCSRR
eukprot:COSAG01_NODE_4461_length_5002_cov_2.196410_4_plen_170_part_00